MALTDNLEAFWELEEASGTRNDSFSTNHLTDNATVTQAVGKVGNAGQFTDSNTEYLSRTDNAALSAGDTDFTLQFWVYADTLTGSSGFPVVGSKGWNGTPDAHTEWAVYYNNGAGRWTFAVADGTTSTPVEATNAGAASTGTWYCLHVWHDSVNNQIGIAVNAGTADTASWTTGVANGTRDFVLGASLLQSLYWNGRIDQVGFWRRVLTSQDRTDLYNSGNGLSYAAMAPPAFRLVRFA